MMRTVSRLSHLILVSVLFGLAFVTEAEAGPAAHGTSDRPGTPPAGAMAAPSALERVEADVSTRTIAVTSAYSGSEVLIFGTIENSRQPSAESGFYDIVIVVEGAPIPVTLRKKSRVAGLWINTESFNFSAAPSYYAVASTRPLEDFTDPDLREELGLGLEAIRLTASPPAKGQLSSEDLLANREAIVRLRQGQGLFKRDDYGVVFTGRSLFRSTIELPATVPVGPLSARIYLFNDGELLSRYQARVVLEREGMERWLYAFATERPLLYGLFTVFMAVVTGLAASRLLQWRTS